MARQEMNKRSRSAQYLKLRFYSDPRYDGTLRFYSWIREYISPTTIMLNLGAGAEVGTPIRSFKGEVERVVGADIDPAVYANPGIDQAYVYEDTLPFAPHSFDIVLSDYVLEHVEHPEQFLREVCRVLKPSGAFFFRTPNLYHYVSLIARFTPHYVHLLLANRMRGLNQESHEPWPTYHRLNTPRRIRYYAQRAGFTRSELRLIESEPSYLLFHPVPFLFGLAYERAVNCSRALAILRANIFGRLVK